MMRVRTLIGIGLLLLILSGCLPSRRSERLADQSQQADGATDQATPADLSGTDQFSPSDLLSDSPTADTAPEDSSVGDTAIEDLGNPDTTRSDLPPSDLSTPDTNVDTVSPDLSPKDLGQDSSVDTSIADLSDSHQTPDSTDTSDTTNPSDTTDAGPSCNPPVLPPTNACQDSAVQTLILNNSVIYSACVDANCKTQRAEWESCMLANPTTQETTCQLKRGTFWLCRLQCTTGILPEAVLCGFAHKDDQLAQICCTYDKFPKLGVDCAYCYLQEADCVNNKCNDECTSGTDTDCQQCRKMKGCDADFAKCAGPLPMPRTSFSKTPGRASNATEIELQWDCDQPSCSFECKFDNEEWKSCGTSFKLDFILEGGHMLQVRARNGSSNPEAEPRQWFWNHDFSKPSTTIDTAPPNTTSDTSATFEFSCNEAGCSFECKINGGLFEPCTSPKTYPSVPTGQHTFSVQATDPAGNKEQTPTTHDWTVN